MTPLATIQEHHRLLDDVHQCALETNRFLRLHQRPPGKDFLMRRRILLEQLDCGLAALRNLPANAVHDPDTRNQLEQTRARILQVLQLDKENEELLLRCSLNSGHPKTTTLSTPSPTLLQKIYGRSA